MFGHGYVPRSAGWGNGRDCAQSFGKTEDDAKVLAHQVAGHTHSIEHDEELLCHTETRIDAVQKSIAKLGVSVARATEIRRKQHPGAPQSYSSSPPTGCTKSARKLLFGACSLNSS